MEDSTTSALRGARLAIAPLDENNWTSWKANMKAVLMRGGKWIIVSGREPRPSTGSAQLDWDRRDGEAYGEIYLHVSDLYKHILNGLESESAQEAWEALRAHFEDVGSGARLHLKASLYSSKMDPAETFDHFVLRVKELVTRLTNLGEDNTKDWERETRDVILMGCLHLFQTTIDALESRTRRDSHTKEWITPSLGETISSLREADTRRRRLDADEGGVLFSGKRIQKNRQGSGNNPQRSTGKADSTEKYARNPNIKCFNCGKRGHISAECRGKRQKDKEKKQSGERDNGHAHVAEGHDECDGCVLLATGSSFSPHEWLLDSCASFHIAASTDGLHDISDMPAKTLRVGNDAILTATQKGQLRLTLRGRKVTIEDIYIFPGMVRNLLSIGRLTAKGAHFVFHGKGCDILLKDRLLGTGARLRDHLYRLDVDHPNDRNQQLRDRSADLRSPPVPQALYSEERTAPSLLHARLGHAGSSDGCETCALAKINKTNVPRFRTSDPATRASKPLEKIHSDVMTLPVKSLGGARYAIVFLDEATRYVTAYCMKHKSESFDKYLAFRSAAENHTGAKIKSLQSDGGGEYINDVWKRHLTEAGIRHFVTVRDSPHQNGMAERVNRTLGECMRAILLHHHAPDTFWAEALLTTVYLYNRTRHTSLRNRITPFEAWYGSPPPMQHLRVFGCLAIARIPETRRKGGKLGSRGERTAMLGYSDERKGWRLWQPATRRTIWSRDVTFFEDRSGFDAPASSIFDDEPYMTSVPPATPAERHNTSDQEDSDGDEEFSVAPEPVELGGVGPSDQPTPSNPDIPSSSTSTNAQVRPSTPMQEQPRRSERIRAQTAAPESTASETPRRSARLHARGRQGNALLAGEHMPPGEQPQDPQSYDEAIHSKHAAEWRRAIQAELDSLTTHGTWEPQPVRPPAGRKLIGCKWVFKTKITADGRIDRRKARLVAKGYSQIPGIDYDDTFAPVMRMTTLRVAFALAATRNLEIEAVDVKSAYLNGVLDEELYMEIPQGTAIEAARGEGLRLRKPLYGLKQAGRAWSARLRDALEKQGFSRLNADHGAFVRPTDGAWILSWVDDLLIFAQTKGTITSIKMNLAKEFDITEAGRPTSVVGIHITYSAGEIRLDQKAYISALVDKYGLADARTVATPGGIIEKAEERGNAIDAAKYRELVGALLYVAMGTRPDVAFVVGHLGRHQSAPKELDWTAALRVLRYLKGTADLCLRFRRDANRIDVIANRIDIDGTWPRGFCDADYAECRETRRSTSGHVFLLAGAAISWRSRRQEVVATSTTEAEYIALAEGAKEAIWLRHLLEELDGGKTTARPIIIMEDNRGALLLVENPVNHAKSKHIDVRYHFVRECAERGEIRVVGESSEEMTADILTKALNRVKHEKHLGGLGLVK